MRRLRAAARALCIHLPHSCAPNTGSAYYSHAATANAAGKAMDMSLLNKSAISNMKTFVPIIAA